MDDERQAPVDPMARPGVHWTAEQGAQIIALIEAGKIVEAQRIILDVLTAHDQEHGTRHDDAT